MAIRNSIAIRDKIGGYEQVTIVGIILTVLGSTMGWIEVTAEPGAAAELDDVPAGTTTLSGTEVSFGAVTMYLAIVAAVVLALVLWRYRTAGRKTGLLVMLIGLITAAVATVGIVLTSMIFGPAGWNEGVTVSLGSGIFVTLLGAVLMLSGGALRLATGPPKPGQAGPSR